MAAPPGRDEKKSRESSGRVSTPTPVPASLSLTGASPVAAAAVASQTTVNSYILCGHSTRHAQSTLPHHPLPTADAAKPRPRGVGAAAAAALAATPPPARLRSRARIRPTLQALRFDRGRQASIRTVSPTAHAFCSSWA